MSGNQVKEYLRILEEMVMDEEKIVTYKLLSRTVNVNVNAAKQLMHLYLTKQQSITPCTVSATHLLAGLLKDGTFLVSIISGNKLDEAYSKYDKITSDHVYSIQKGKELGIEKNSQMLFAVDSFLQPPINYPIKYHKVLKEKTDDKIKKNICQNVEVKTEVKQKVSPLVKENKVSSASSTCKEEKPKAKKPGHISNFFNNQSQRKKVDKQEKTEVKSEAIKAEVSKNDDKSEVPEILVSDTPHEEESKDKPSSSSKTVKKTRVKEKKKRKRIVSASEDSESDEERTDALLCGEPEVPQVAERLRISDDDANEDDLFLNKRKRKKVVNKTVLHDDGFMETFSEVVEETDSDMESPKEKKKEAKMGGDEVTSGKSAEKVEKEESGGGRGKTQTQKGNPKKQATLFSFFKKN